jgi:predicted ferric reductase
MNAEIRGRTAVGKRALLFTIFASLMVLLAVMGGRDIDWSAGVELRHSPVFAVGRILGLWAICLVLLQGITAARFTWLDQAFGHDRLIKLHRCSAIAALSFSFFHPMVLLSSGLRLPESGDFLIWPLALGGLALLGLWFQLISSEYRGFMLLRWETWRLFHYVAIPATFIALVHMFAISPGLRSGWPMSAWIVLLSIWMSAMIWARLIRPRCTAKRRLHTVTNITTIAEGITEVTLSRADGTATFPFMPGQFMFVRFTRSSLPDEEHPFTICSSPDNRSEIQLAAKHCGDFTNQLDRLRRGDSANVSGPHGGFTPWRFGIVYHRILVAGGIGITPILSILRTLALQESKLRVTLVWSNRTYDDLPYRDELDRLKESCPQLTVTHVITRGAASPHYLSGRLDLSTTKELFPDWSVGTHVMICGPEGMTRDLCKAFRARGYPAKALHRELFAL